MVARSWLDSPCLTSECFASDSFSSDLVKVESYRIISNRCIKSFPTGGSSKAKNDNCISIITTPHSNKGNTSLLPHKNERKYRSKSAHILFQTSNHDLRAFWMLLMSSLLLFSFPVTIISMTKIVKRSRITRSTKMLWFEGSGARSAGGSAIGGVLLNTVSKGESRVMKFGLELEAIIMRDIIQGATQV